MSDRAEQEKYHLSNFSNVVIKIGSALLVDRNTGLKKAWLEALCEDISKLTTTGANVLIVSSGAIALGRTILGLPNGALKLEESQAAAATGQIELARSWSEALGKYGIKTGQILLTLGDTEQRRRYLNARSTIATLTRLGAVPIINENDTVATSEIRYGDNDRLAARVASMMGCDALVLLSDIDGLYTSPPNENPEAKRIPLVASITTEIESMAGSAGTDLSRGGMVTKIMAARTATDAGTAMVITSGKELHPLQRLNDGGPCTWFEPSDTPVSARKKWIAGQMQQNGSLKIDHGAEQALVNGKSLLPAGVVEVSGDFQRGDVVRILDGNGEEMGCGMIAYDAQEATAIAGRKSHEIEARLGYVGRSEMIHRDDMVLKSDISSATRSPAK